MKKLFIIFTLFFTNSVFAGIYTNNNFKPYIGIDFGFNITDYTIKTDLAQDYISATINAGAKIGRNFGVELFFSHSSTNDVEYIMDFEALDHEIYYQAYGFDIFGYYNISKEFDFFTSFGVANYKIFNKFDYINPYTDQTEKTTENDVSTRLGIGVMYTFPGDDISILGQYQYTPLNNDFIKTMSEFSVGARYIF